MIFPPQVWYNTVEEYDPATNKWITKTPMSTARLDLTSSVVNGKIYVIGGQNQQGEAINTVEEYDPVTNKWTTKTSMPAARSGLTSSTVSNKIYVIGGARDGVLNTVEEYNPFYEGACTSEVAAKPYTFTPGTSAKATEVNADFDTLYKNDINLNCQIQALKALVCQDHPTASVCQ